MDRMRKLSLGVPPFAKSAINTAPSIWQGNYLPPQFPTLSPSLDLVPRISIPPTLARISRFRYPIDLSTFISDRYLPYSVPIGAYSPRHIMSPVHCSPADSVLLHHDIKSK